MAIFKPDTPIETKESSVEVTVSEDNLLPPGVYRFQLVVVDDNDNASEPQFAEVIISDTQKPTAVIDAPRDVEFGQSFKLSGERSTDLPPGRIDRYIWTMVPIPERPPVRPPRPIDPDPRPRPIDPDLRPRPIDPNRRDDILRPQPPNG